MSHRPDSGLFCLATSLLYLLSCAVFASVNRALSAHPVSQGIYSQADRFFQWFLGVRERQCRILDSWPPPTVGGSWSNNQNPITGVQICPTDPTKVLLPLNQRFSRTRHLLSFGCSEAGGRRGAGRLTCCWWCGTGNSGDFCCPSCFQITHTCSLCQRFLSQGFGGVWPLVEQVRARRAWVPSGIAVRHSGSGSGCQILFPSSFWRTTVSVMHASRSLLWLYSQSPDTVWVTCNSYLPRKVSYLWEGLPSVALALAKAGLKFCIGATDMCHPFWLWVLPVGVSLRSYNIKVWGCSSVVEHLFGMD